MTYDDVAYLMTMMYLGIGDEDHSFDDGYDKELWDAMRRRREDLHARLDACLEAVCRKILEDIREDRDAQPADMPGNRQEDVRQQEQGEEGAGVRKIQEEAAGVPPA